MAVPLVPTARVAAMACIAAVAVVAALRSTESNSTPAPAALSATAEHTEPIVGRFDSLPRFPHSEATGRVEATGTSVAREFRVVGATPADVLEFYADALVEWRRVRVPTASPTSVMRWVEPEYTLTIGAEMTRGSGASPVTTYHVDLRAR